MHINQPSTPTGADIQIDAHKHSREEINTQAMSRMVSVQAGRMAVEQCNALHITETSSQQHSTAPDLTVTISNLALNPLAASGQRKQRPTEHESHGGHSSVKQHQRKRRGAPVTAPAPAQPGSLELWVQFNKVCCCVESAFHHVQADGTEYHEAEVAQNHD